MATVGSGKYTYEVIENWGTLPSGWGFGPVSAVAVDSQDRVYAFQRKDPPVIVLDKDGNFLNSWGTGQITDPHGIYIDANDIVYVTDRDDHLAMKFTLDGKSLSVIGERGKPSDTGCDEDSGPVPRPAGPFNKPTELFPSPSGDLYASDGYRNSRVHRFSADGKLKSSWGTYGKAAPGEFHLPHSVWVDREGLVYVCDRENSRVQVFTADGEFVSQWTGMVRPCDMWMDANETVFIGGVETYVSVYDKQGNVLERVESPRTHGLFGDSRGDLYLAQLSTKRVSKFVNVS